VSGRTDGRAQSVAATTDDEDDGAGAGVNADGDDGDDDCDGDDVDDDNTPSALYAPLSGSLSSSALRSSLLFFFPL
jgi:hypothetical protein